MADDKIVSYIRYSFSLSDLFGETPSRYETEPSVQRYQALCEQDLRAKYPTAEQIEVIRSDTEGVLSAPLGTTVYTWPDFEEDPKEVEVVKEICAIIFERRSDWLVLKNLIPISEGISKAHRCILRWGCVIGLLKGAIKSSGHWEAPLNVLEQFDKSLNMLKADTFIIATPNKRMLACFAEDIKDDPILGLLEQYDEVLLYPRNQTKIHFLAPNNCYFLFSRTGSTVQISIEQFIDVQSWPNDAEWPYAKYAKALVQQAKRNGIDAECVIDGVVFRFRRSLQGNPTAQILLKKVIEELLVAVGETELSLSGGPTWDKVEDEIYQKEEDKFCNDVLFPLLRQMGFKRLRYTAGNRGEHGRDFVFAYQMPFNEIVYWGLQAKVGPIGGSAKSEINAMLKQIDDAFVVPYTREPGSSTKEIHISCMILAISGEFTDDAKEKITAWIPKYHFPIGSLFLWDKTIIKNLIAQQDWQRSK